MIIRKEHPWCCRAWTTPAGQVCVGAPAGAQTTSGKFNYLSIRDHWTFFSCTSINMQFPPPPLRRRSTSTTRRHAIPCRGLPSPHADLSFHPAPPHMSRPPLILSWGVVYFVQIRVGGAGVCEVVFVGRPLTMTTTTTTRQYSNDNKAFSETLFRGYGLKSSSKTYQLLYTKSRSVSICFSFQRKNFSN